MAWYNNSGDAGAAAGGYYGGSAGKDIGRAIGSGDYEEAGDAFTDAMKKGLKGVTVPNAKGYDVNPGAFQDPFHNANADRFWGGADAAAGRTGNEQFRNGQADLISTLQGAVAGNAPSVAENTLRSGADRALAQATSLNASGMGSSNPSLASRAIGMAHGAIAQNTARDAATLRAGEISQARGELGAALGQARSGDLQQQAANDALVSKYLELGLTNDQAQFQAQQELERLRVQEALGTQQTNANIGAGNQQFWGQLGGSGAGAVGAAFASDEKTKKNVQPGGSEVQAFLDDIRSKGFDYKTSGPGMAPGRHVGVMAQDLEAAGPIGKGMVATAPGGVKMVDAGQAAGTALAASADLNERLKRLERPAAAAPTTKPTSKPSVGRRMIDWIRSSGSVGGIGAHGEGVTAGVGG